MIFLSLTKACARPSAHHAQCTISPVSSNLRPCTRSFTTRKALLLAGYSADIVTLPMKSRKHYWSNYVKLLPNGGAGVLKLVVQQVTELQEKVAAAEERCRTAESGLLTVQVTSQLST